MPEGIDRDLLLTDTINDEVVGKIIIDILKINNNDKTLEGSYGDKYIVKPIKLYINSGGGKVYSTLALVDIIRNSNTPIDTYCFGHAMSGGLWIFSTGRKRYIGKNSTLMYHAVTLGVRDKIVGVKEEVKQSGILQNLFDNQIIETSNVSKKILEKHQNEKSDWYISAEEALKLGLADKIL